MSTPSAPRLVTADDLCVAAAIILDTHLLDVVRAQGWHEAPGALKPVTTWEQIPTLEALSSARYPVGAVTSPGLTSRPTRTTKRRHDATWRISVGVWDRGVSYQDTASRVRRWAAAVRATLLDHRTLGGIADGLWWAGEEYRQNPTREAARTLGGCAVSFDVDVSDVVDLTAPPDGPGTGPVVLSTSARITTRPLPDQE